jgi:pyruvate dehydrogenase E1 component beta subunit
MATLRETILKISKHHVLYNDSYILGQCLSAIGWVDGTVPDVKNIIELPMVELTGAGIATGIAVAGKRPILVIRFQDFLIQNGSVLINYAAKRKELFGKGCPLWVRALAKEGDGTGGTHSGKLHSTFIHFPGLRIYAPITSGEYQECWEDFMRHDDPAICFEHRDTFGNDKEFFDVRSDNKVTIYAVSLARLNALKAVDILAEEGIYCNLIHIYKLKPLVVYPVHTKGLIVDTGFEDCGFARDLAYQLMVSTGKKHIALGLKDTSVTCRKGFENLTPSVEQITYEARRLWKG